MYFTCDVLYLTDIIKATSQFRKATFSFNANTPEAILHKKNVSDVNITQLNIYSKQ